MDREQARQVRQAYASLVASQDWDLFTTATYAIPRHDSLRVAQRLWAILEDKFSADRAFVVVEPHRLGSLHAHALSRHAMRPKLEPASVKLYLEKAYGFASCGEPRDDLGVARYCAKYVVKSANNLDNYFFFGDTWNRG